MENNKCAGNMRLRGMRKHQESLSLRKPKATSLTSASSFNCENIKAFLGNLNELMSRHKFSANKINHLDEYKLSE
jgi:hypothetical protein